MGAVVPLISFAARVAALRIGAAAVAIVAFVAARAGAVLTVDICTVGAHVGASCCLAHSCAQLATQLASGRAGRRQHPATDHRTQPTRGSHGHCKCVAYLQHAPPAKVAAERFGKRRGIRTVGTPEQRVWRRRANERHDGLGRGWRQHGALVRWSHHRNSRAMGGQAKVMEQQRRAVDGAWLRMLHDASAIGWRCKCVEPSRPRALDAFNHEQHERSARHSKGLQRLARDGCFDGRIGAYEFAIIALEI